MREIELTWLNIENIIKNALEEQINKEIEDRLDSFEKELFKRKDEILIKLVASIQQSIYKAEDEVIIKIPVRK